MRTATRLLCLALAVLGWSPRASAGPWSVGTFRLADTEDTKKFWTGPRDQRIGWEKFYKRRVPQEQEDGGRYMARDKTKGRILAAVWHPTISTLMPGRGTLSGDATIPRWLCIFSSRVRPDGKTVLRWVARGTEGLNDAINLPDKRGRRRELLREQLDKPLDPSELCAYGTIELNPATTRPGLFPRRDGQLRIDAVWGGDDWLEPIDGRGGAADGMALDCAFAPDPGQTVPFMDAEPGSEPELGPPGEGWDISLNDLPASIYLRKAGEGWTLTFGETDKTAYPCTVDTGDDTRPNELNKMTIECRYRDNFGNGLAGPYQAYKFEGEYVRQTKPSPGIVNPDKVTFEGYQGTYTYTASETREAKDDSRALKQTGKWRATRHRAPGP